MKAREVTVTLIDDVWFVMLVHRKPRTRKSVAQFNSKDWSRAQVVAWVINNPKLRLTNYCPE